MASRYAAEVVAGCVVSRAKGTVSSEVTSETHYALPKKLIPNSNVGMVTQFIL